MSDSNEQQASLAAMLANAVTGMLTRLLLVVVFFILFLPLGWIMRLFGGDPLRRRIRPSADSYYEPSRERPRDHMDRPY